MVQFLSNSEYLFELFSSSNLALKVDNNLSIIIGNDSIIKCSILTYNNPNYVDCTKSISPTIDYHFVKSKKNIFDISVILINSTKNCNNNSHKWYTNKN